MRTWKVIVNSKDNGRRHCRQEIRNQQGEMFALLDGHNVGIIPGHDPNHVRFGQGYTLEAEAEVALLEETEGAICPMTAQANAEWRALRVAYRAREEKAVTFSWNGEVLDVQ